MTLQHLSAMARGRNWHLASAGCQGFIGPVPPPFWISRDETDKDPAKSYYAAIGPDCQEGGFGSEGPGWVSAHPASSVSRALTCRLPRPLKAAMAANCCWRGRDLPASQL